MKPNILKSRHWIKYNLTFIIEHFLGKDYFNNKDNNFKSNLLSDIRDYLESNEINLKKNTGIFSTTDEVHNSPDTHILYKGITKNWPASKKWNLDFFKQNYGDRTILLNNTKGIVDPNAPQELEEIDLKSYIQQLEQGSLKYLKLSNLAQQEKSLQEDLDLEWLNKFKNKACFGETFYLFIGGKNTITPLHNEFPMTIYMQVHGKKKWTLYTPEDRVFLNAKTERMPYFYSDYKPDKDYNKSFPIAHYARKYEVILEPGDILVVPPFHWHYIQNLTTSIGIAYKYIDIFASLKSSKLLTSLFFLSTKPSIFYSFIATRLKKDDYILTKKNKTRTH